MAPGPEIAQKHAALQTLCSTMKECFPLVGVVVPVSKNSQFSVQVPVDLADTAGPFLSLKIRACVWILGLKG